MDNSFIRVLFTAFVLVLIMMSTAPNFVSANGDSSGTGFHNDFGGNWDDNNGGN
ncbi:hypothetical protein MKW94_013316 [Papaver nudicaule]|uniref:Glycine-rich protein n=1 Tax=Papaver nudicaule TaxID=74823 RepID=A0AA41SCU9_PAPNU|nr:hypothetical protein [Papaver nudicaule]